VSLSHLPWYIWAGIALAHVGLALFSWSLGFRSARRDCQLEIRWLRADLLRSLRREHYLLRLLHRRQQADYLNQN